MATEELIDGIVRFGKATDPSHVACGRWGFDFQRDFVTTKGTRQLGGDESQAPYGSWGYWLITYPVGDGDNGGLYATARIVDSPVFDAVQDHVSLELWADGGQTIVAQSRPILLVGQRDASTGAWADPLRVDGSTLGSVSGTGGTVTLECVWLAKDKKTATGVPSLVWSETPSTTDWAARTSWTDITPPTAAVYVALRYSWEANGGPGGGGWVWLREPSIGWVSTDLRNVTSDDFAQRYQTYAP
jgi:hypothetical protein